MSDDPLPSSVEDAMSVEVERILQAGVFGTSGRLYELFKYLADRSISGTPPKEAEITFDVFGRNAGNVKYEGTARVYIHRLRRKLESFYETGNHPAEARLSIPKGEYRLVISTNRPEGDVPGALAARRPLPRNLVWFLLAIVLVTNIAVWLFAWPRTDATVTAARQSDVWQTVEKSNRPLLVVLGDYYLFADYSGGPTVRRLIRDFKINSKDDLLDYLVLHSEKTPDYADVKLSYLPTSEAPALAYLVPVVSKGKDVSYLTSSTITPSMLMGNDIVYIGLMSGLGSLQDSAFEGARFTIDDSYDDITDRKTGKKYSSFNPMFEKGNRRVDYALLSTYMGPTGNRIMLITGTRDEALSSLSKRLAFMRPGDEIDRQIGKTKYYEALFEVNSDNTLSAPPRLLAFSPRAVKMNGPAGL